MHRRSLTIPFVNEHCQRASIVKERGLNGGVTQQVSFRFESHSEIVEKPRVITAMFIAIEKCQVLRTNDFVPSRFSLLPLRRFNTVDSVRRTLCVTLNSVVSITMQRCFLSPFPPIKFSKMRSLLQRESRESTRETALRERHFNFPPAE